MKGYLISVFVLINVVVNAQDTKEIKKTVGDHQEIYSALKSNPEIKQGTYEKYYHYANPFKKGKLLVERGSYENNVKAGLWESFWGEKNLLASGMYEKGVRSGKWQFFTDGIMVESGLYKNDLRDGVWNYFDKDKGIIERGAYYEGRKVGKWTYRYFNVLVQTYDHSADSVLQSYRDTASSEVMINNALTKVKLQRDPQYVGHKHQMQVDQSALTEYPMQARRMGIHGNVAVSFFIEKDGTTSGFEILEDIGEGCGQAVIEAYKKNPVRWIAGLYEGQRVKVKYYQVVRFSLLIDPETEMGKLKIVYE